MTRSGPAVVRSAVSAPGAGALTFVSCTIERWDSPWLTHQPIMSAFAEENHVLYVLPEPSVDEVLAHARHPFLPPSGLERQRENVYELVPSKWWPRVYRSDRAERFFRQRRAAEIDRAVGRLGWHHPVLYLWNPRFHDLIGRVTSELNVFHVHDYYPGFCAPGTAERRAVEQAYHETLRRSDLVVVCGEALLADVRARGLTNVLLVENGVAFQRLRNGAGTEAPPELAGLPRPIVAYVGRINNTVDFGALARIADQRPGWSLVVLGPRSVSTDANERKFRAYLERPNAHYIGGRNAEDLGRYLNAIDVGLIAYERDGIFAHRFPLKMIEYFALGKPVVSVDIPAVRKFAPLARVVSGESEWVPAIEAALKDDNATVREQRVDEARARDWQRQAALILQAIDLTRQADIHGVR